MIYHRVSLTLDGDSTKLGDGEQVLSMSGELLEDPSKPAGERYVQTDLIE